MVIFKKILFPVDLSEDSKIIVPYVKDFVDRFGAELRVVHSKYVDQYYISTFVDETDLESTEAEENQIRDFIESNFANLCVQSEILSGPPGPMIIQYAENKGIDLIVMGHNSKGMARAVFGSVAGYVVKYSRVPVLVINGRMLKRDIPFIHRDASPHRRSTDNKSV